MAPVFSVSKVLLFLRFFGPDNFNSPTFFIEYFYKLTESLIKIHIQLNNIIHSKFGKIDDLSGRVVIIL